MDGWPGARDNESAFKEVPVTARWVLAVLSSGLALGAIALGCAAQTPTPGSAGGAATTVHVYDPTARSPAQISWQAYPAPPPAGFHWQHTGSPAIQVDPQGRPLPGQNTGSWILVRDGYDMPTMK
jgi:hypothetical protein